MLSQRLYIEKRRLPAALLNRLKRLAAFQNPEFYKKQRMRLSTAKTPRVITCADELAQFITLPRGCTPEAERLLREYGITFNLEDERQPGTPLDLRFHGDLTPIQSAASRALLSHDTGVFVGPPGIGRTVLGTHLVASRARNTLILVHRKPLLEQWVAQLAMFLNIDEKEIVRIGGGHCKSNGTLDVAMIQSLVRKDAIDELVTRYGHVIVDECHHLPAVSFEKVLSAVKARYITGITATPQRRDGRHPIGEMQLGPVRFKVDHKTQSAQRPFTHKLVVRETGFQHRYGTNTSIQELYAALANDPARNTSIVNDIIGAIQEGRSPILLTERKDHSNTWPITSVTSSATSSCSVEE